MKQPVLRLILLCSILLSSCSYVQNYRDKQLHSESGLYDVPLEHSYKVAIDGLWLPGTGNPYANQKKLNFYVAPLNVSLVEEEYPDFTPTMVEQMDKLMTEELTKVCNEANAANKTQWRVTHNEAEADVRFDLAVVSLRKHKPGLHIVAKVLGYVAPSGVGDAVELVAKGDITLEGTIRDRRTGRLLMAFKDANRAPLRFYHIDTYRRSGHVDANLRLWAEKLALLCRESAHDRLGNDTIKHKLQERSMGDVIKTRVKDAL